MLLFSYSIPFRGVLFVMKRQSIPPAALGIIKLCSNFVIKVPPTIISSLLSIGHRLTAHYYGNYDWIFFFPQPKTFSPVLLLRDGFLIERRTRDRKVASSNSGRSGGRIFFSRVNFVY